MPTDYMVINATIPSYWGWTQYTPVIPKLYWDVYSQEERIKRLCKEYDKITHYISMLADSLNDINTNVDEILTEFETKITEQLQAQDEKITEQLEAQDAKIDTAIKDLIAYVEQTMNDIAEGQYTYDPTTGEYRPSKEAMRRLLQALSYSNTGERQLVSYLSDNVTVEELAAMTTYKAAYSNRDTITIDDQN